MIRFLLRISSFGGSPPLLGTLQFSPSLLISFLTLFRFWVKIGILSHFYCHTYLESMYPLPPLCLFPNWPTTLFSPTLLVHPFFLAFQIRSLRNERTMISTTLLDIGPIHMFQPLFMVVLVWDKPSVTHRITADGVDNLFSQNPRRNQSSILLLVDKCSLLRPLDHFPQREWVNEKFILQL